MLSEDVQRLDVGKYVELFTLDFTKIGGQVLYLTPNSKEDGNGLRFQGKVYAPAAIMADGFDVSAKGPLPTPTLRITNTVRSLTAIVNDLGDCKGGIITRIKTLEAYLDGEPTADPSEHFPLDIYKIRQMTGMNKSIIEWQLAAAIDVQGVEVPRRKVSAAHCGRIYRKYNAATDSMDNSNASCPYAGTNYFDINDKPTTKDKDRCSKFLTGCKLRFGRGGLPSWAFPGAGKYAK
jgi:lambda family phage minor tail protein L